MRRPPLSLQLDMDREKRGCCPDGHVMSSMRIEKEFPTMADDVDFALIACGMFAFLGDETGFPDPREEPADFFYAEQPRIT